MTNASEHMPAPVAIAAQGSFAVGGTVVSRDGSFDPRNLLGQSRRGSAGKTTTATPIPTDPNEQWFFNQFRLGLWPDLPSLRHQGRRRSAPYRSGLGDGRGVENEPVPHVTRR
jgi:hypothetical protein